MSTKICTRCNTEKDVSQFTFKFTENRYTAGCKECLAIRVRAWRSTSGGKERVRNYRTSPHGKAVRLMVEAKERAADKNLPLTIDVPWIRARIAAGKCQVTEIPFDMEPAGNSLGARAFGASLDRITPKLGYTPENTQVVVWIYNRAKGVQGHAEVMKLAEALCQRP